MKLLVLGGTRFLGRAVVELAIERGHEVTLFNRGYHGSELFPDVPKRRGDRNADVSALAGGNWDAVVDTSGYLPRAARLIADAVGRRVHHYTFISSIAVYRGLATGHWTEDLAVPEAGGDDIRRAEQVVVGEVAGASYGHLYGPLKGSCERIIGQAFDRALIVRPGLVVGPWDFGGDRFAYWPRRVGEGGEVLAPGRADAPLQVIDVRDLAHWILDMIERDRSGTYNAVGPEEPVTMARLLDQCREVTGSNASFTWVDDEFLVGAGVNICEIPLWSPKAASPMQSTVPNALACAAGLSFRPLWKTIKDTLSWEADHPQPVSFPRNREQEILASWRAAAQPGVPET